MELLKFAMSDLNLSARAYDRVLKACDQIERVRRNQPHRMQIDLDMWIEAADGGSCTVNLAAADVGGRVNHLPLEVGQCDLVVVDDADGADARGREIEQHRRAQAAGSHHQHTRALERSLPRPADLAQDDMAGIAFKLLRAEHGKSRFAVAEFGPIFREKRNFANGHAC